MAKSLNRCQFIGNLGSDVTMKYLPNGDAVANFSIGCSESFKKDGQVVERTEWVRAVAFRKLGEICGEYLQKGAKVYVSGKMQTREWEKDGVKRYSTEIVLDDMLMLGGKGESQPQRQQPKRAQQQSQQGAAPDFDDDIPFRQAHYITGM